MEIIRIFENKKNTRLKKNFKEHLPLLIGSSDSQIDAFPSIVNFIFKDSRITNLISFFASTNSLELLAP